MKQDIQFNLQTEYFFKKYRFLYFAKSIGKNFGKNISKVLSSKYSQKIMLKNIYNSRK